MTAYYLLCALAWVGLGCTLGHGLRWHARLLVVVLAPAVALLTGCIALIDDSHGPRRMPSRLPMVRGRTTWPDVAHDHSDGYLPRHVRVVVRDGRPAAPADAPTISRERPGHPTTLT